MPQVLALMLALGQMDPQPPPINGPIYSTPARTAGGGLFRMAPAGGLGMGTECGNTVITGSRGETITFIRSSASTCALSDGGVTALSSGRPPVELWGSERAYRVQPGRTNRVLRNRDLSNAAWTLSNMTAARTAIGADGAANSATTLTATGANATVLQLVTIASASRSTSAYVKRRTGSGTVSMTRDNGATWIDITSSLSSAAFFRATPATHAGLCTTAANPTVGIKLDTSGDAVDVDYFQDENSSFGGGICWASPPIETAGSVVSRANAAAYAAWPSSATGNFSISADFCMGGSSQDGIIWSVSNGGILDRLFFAFDPTNALGAGVGWYVNTPSNRTATVVDAWSVGGCRHMWISWDNTSRRATFGVLTMAGVGIGTATTPATEDAGISDAAQLNIGWQSQAGTSFNSNLIKNVCLDNTLEGCR